MNWSPWQLKFGSHICAEMVQNSSSLAANWLEDRFGVQQEPANNEDLAENQELQHSGVMSLV